MDFLLSAALAYKKLMNKTYSAKAGKQGKLLQFDFYFAPLHFYHLIGFQYLDDLPQLKGNGNDKALTLKKILSGDITMETIIKSSHFSEIRDRVIWFHKIDHLVTRLYNIRNKSVYKYSPKIGLVEADLLMVDEYLYHKSQKMILHLYLTGENRKGINTGMYIPNSFIPEKCNTRLIGQANYKILEFSSVVKK